MDNSLAAKSLYEQELFQGFWGFFFKFKKKSDLVQGKS